MNEIALASRRARVCLASFLHLYLRGNMRGFTSVAPFGKPIQKPLSLDGKEVTIKTLHAAVARDTYRSLQEQCEKMLCFMTLRKHSKTPDIDSFFKEVGGRFRELFTRAGKIVPCVPTGFIDHFYNPRRDEGGGMKVVEKHYGKLVRMLKEGRDLEAVSRESAILVHFLADICVPYHARGKPLRFIWHDPVKRDHLRYEAELEKRQFEALATPAYLKGGPTAIRERYRREAETSYNRATTKSCSQLIKDAQWDYERAVQLASDVLYTAFIEAGKLPKPQDALPETMHEGIMRKAASVA